jgi:hypothetical protein
MPNVSPYPINQLITAFNGHIRIVVETRPICSIPSDALTIAKPIQARAIPAHILFRIPIYHTGALNSLFCISITEDAPAKLYNNRAAIVAILPIVATRKTSSHAAGVPEKKPMGSPKG